MAIFQTDHSDGVVSLTVRSLMQGRIALDLQEVRVDTADGSPAISLPAPLSCVLSGGARVTLAATSDGDLMHGRLRFSIAATAVPLDDPGRSIYREWAWLRRPTEIALIDEELAKMDALPECAGRGVPTNRSDRGSHEH